MATSKKREPIRPGETLLLTDFLDRASLGRAAWRTVRVRCKELGIRIVSYTARQAYVSTDAWLQYLAEAETTHKATDIREAARN